MIQRIQSLFLLLAIVLVAALLALGFPFESHAAEAFAWFAPAVSLLGGLVVLLAGLALFQFRDRPKQSKTVLWAFLLADVLGIVQVIGYALAGDFEALSTLGIIALVLPFAASALLLLARVYIGKDIALVRSMDRLR